MLTRLLFLALVLPVSLCAQLTDKLNKRTDSLLTMLLQGNQLHEQQHQVFSKILKHRNALLKQRVDSGNYGVLILDEYMDIQKNTFRTVESYIKHGFNYKCCVNDTCEMVNQNWLSTDDWENKMVLNWPYKLVDSLEPDPIVFARGCISEPSPKIKKQMKKAEQAEKKSGGYLSPVWEMITVLDLDRKRINTVFRIPVKRIREVKYVCLSGP